MYILTARRLPPSGVGLPPCPPPAWARAGPAGVASAPPGWPRAAPPNPQGLGRSQQGGGASPCEPPPPSPSSLTPPPPAPPAGLGTVPARSGGRGSLTVSPSPCTPSGRDVPRLSRPPWPSASGCSIQDAVVWVLPTLPPTWGAPISRRFFTASCPSAGGRTQHGSPPVWPSARPAAPKTGCHKEPPRLPPGRTSLRRAGGRSPW